MKENFKTKSTLFTESYNSVSSSKYSRLSIGLGMAKLPLFNEFSNIKMMLKMSQKRDYLESKWPLNLFGVEFLCISMY